MGIKEQMIEARQLIKEKRYSEARAILEGIDHPKAREWLTKINQIAPPQATKGASSSTAASSRLMLLGGAAVIVIAVIAGVLLLSGGSGDDTSNDEPQVADQMDEQEDPVVSDGDNDNDDDESMTDTTDMMSGETVRVPFISNSMLVYVDVPPGWVCDCGLSSGNLELIEDAGQRIDVRVMGSSFNPTALVGVPLADVLADDIRDDETVVSQETRSFAGREVLYAVVQDEDGDQDRQFYVADSDGQVVQLSIPSYVDDPDALVDVSLMVAATVEAELPDATLEFTTALMDGTLAYNADLNRWRLGDLLSDDREHTVELPEGWAIEGGSLGLPMAVKNGSSATSATAISLIPSGFTGDADALADIAVQLNEGSSDVIQSTESAEVAGREVYIYTTASSVNNSETRTYLVRDSDGDLMALIVQPQVPNKDSLHDDILFMAGNVESEAVPYVDRLRRAGYVDGEAVDDGFTPVSESAPDVVSADAPGRCEPVDAPPERMMASAVPDFDGVGSASVSYSASTNLWRTRNKDQILRVITVELPAGWAVNNFGNAFQEANPETTEIYFNYLAGYRGELVGAGAELALRSGFTYLSQDFTTVGERDVLVAVIANSDGTEKRWYFVHDSDCEIVYFDPTAGVTDMVALEPDVLSMAANIESVPTRDYEG